MNFISEFKKGQEGDNMGLWMGDGLANVDKHVYGIQRARNYVIASAPKVGKSTLVDNAFLIKPYLYSIKHNLQVEWDYYSFEIDRVSKEFDFVSHFLYYDHGISSVTLPEGVSVNEHKVIPISANYLRGRIKDDNENMVKIDPGVFEMVKKVYEKRIIPMFGEYGSKGELIKKGVINFIEEKDNPTGIYVNLVARAKTEGKFNTVFAGKDAQGRDRERVVGYKPDNPNLHRIIIVDHLRKLKLERGWKIKETVDKFSEYCVDLRNWCGYTFVQVIHTNRSVASSDNMKHYNEYLYPTAESIKDTGNLSEDADYVFTLMNPNDDKYKLNSHFGLELKDTFDNLKYPDLRTIHLVESRHCEFPMHFKVNMLGGVKEFEQLNI